MKTHQNAWIQQIQIEKYPNCYGDNRGFELAGGPWIVNVFEFWQNTTKLHERFA